MNEEGETEEQLAGEAWVHSKPASTNRITDIKNQPGFFSAESISEIEEGETEQERRAKEEQSH